MLLKSIHVPSRRRTLSGWGSVAPLPRSCSWNAEESRPGTPSGGEGMLGRSRGNTLRRPQPVTRPCSSADVANWGPGPCLQVEWGVSRELDTACSEPSAAHFLEMVASPETSGYPIWLSGNIISLVCPEKCQVYAVSVSSKRLVLSLRGLSLFLPRAPPLGISLFLGRVVTGGGSTCPWEKR